MLNLRRRLAGRIATYSGRLTDWLDPLPPLTDAQRAAVKHAIDEARAEPEQFAPFMPPLVLHEAVLGEFLDRATPIEHAPPGWERYLERRYEPDGRVLTDRVLAVADWPEVAEIVPPWQPGEFAREWTEPPHPGTLRARRPGGELVGGDDPLAVKYSTIEEPPPPAVRAHRARQRAIDLAREAGERHAAQCRDGDTTT